MPQSSFLHGKGMAFVFPNTPKIVAPTVLWTTILATDRLNGIETQIQFNCTRSQSITGKFESLHPSPEHQEHEHLLSAQWLQVSRSFLRRECALTFSGFLSLLGP